MKCPKCGAGFSHNRPNGEVRLKCFSIIKKDGELIESTDCKDSQISRLKRERNVAFKLHCVSEGRRLLDGEKSESVPVGILNYTCLGCAEKDGLLDAIHRAYKAWDLDVVTELLKSTAPTTDKGADHGKGNS